MPDTRADAGPSRMGLAPHGLVVLCRSGHARRGRITPRALPARPEIDEIIAVATLQLLALSVNARWRFGLPDVFGSMAGCRQIDRPAIFEVRVAPFRTGRL